MNNLTGFCCISAVVTIMSSLFVISRLVGGLLGGPSEQTSGSQAGPLNSTYKDPDIQGHGSFGRVFNGLPGRRSRKSDDEQSGRIDSDNVQGRGSFGRDKKD